MNIQDLLNQQEVDLEQVFADAGLSVDDSSTLYLNILKPLAQSLVDTRIKPLIALVQDLQALSTLTVGNQGAIHYSDLTEDQKKALRMLGKLKGILKIPGSPAIMLAKAYIKSEVTLPTDNTTFEINYNGITFTGTCPNPQTNLYTSGTASYIWITLIGNKALTGGVDNSTFPKPIPGTDTPNFVSFYEIIALYPGQETEDNESYLYRLLSTMEAGDKRMQTEQYLKGLFPDLETVILFYNDPRMYRLPAFSEVDPTTRLLGATDIVVEIPKGVLEPITLDINPVPISQFVPSTSTEFVNWGGTSLSYASRAFKTVRENGSIKTNADGSIVTQVGVDPTLPELNNYVTNYLNFAEKQDVIDTLQDTLENVKEELSTSSTDQTPLFDGTVLKNKDVLDYLEGVLPGMPLAYRLSANAFKMGYIYKLPLSSFSGSFVAITDVIIDTSSAKYGVDYIIVADKSQLFEIIPENQKAGEIYLIFSSKIKNATKVMVKLLARQDNEYIWNRIHESSYLVNNFDIHLYSPIPVFTHNGSDGVLYPTGGMEILPSITSSTQLYQNNYVAIPGVYQSLGEY